MVCIQETKIEGVDRQLCSMIWEGDDFDWVAKSAEGRSGGLIILWKRGCFVMNSELGISW